MELENYSGILSKSYIAGNNKKKKDSISVLNI